LCKVFADVLADGDEEVLGEGSGVVDDCTLAPVWLLVVALVADVLANNVAIPNPVTRLSMAARKVSLASRRSCESRAIARSLCRTRLAHRSRS
jgi:hypothetical protein